MKKWNIDKVIIEAKKYSYKNEFRKNSNAYQWAIRNAKHDIRIWGHFLTFKRESKFSLDVVIKIAKRYKTRSDFQKGKDKSSYQWCYSNGYLDNIDIFGHMIKPENNRSKWNFKNVKLEAKKYNSRKQFEKNSAGAYKWARTSKCLNEVCSHMKKNFIEWDLDLVIKIAKKYSAKGKFIVENGGAYNWIIRNNHKDNKRIFGHMEKQSSGFNLKEKAILYYLKVENGLAYKIGITNRTVIERFNSKDLSKIEVLSIIEFANGQDAKKEETRILKEYKKYKYEGKKLLKDGNSELFSFDILNLDKEGVKNGNSRN